MFFNQTETEAVADIDREGRKRIRVEVPETDDIGPATVRVLKNSRIIKSITADQFTLITEPIDLDDLEGNHLYRNYKAAVDSTGTILLSFDLTGMTRELNFIGKFLNKSLKIKGSEDVVLYNSQGYLMTDMGSYELPYHMPGLNKVIKSSGNGSDMILYWRHEFETYAEAHEEGRPHERDPEDPDYHLDGTPCIDHDHIIMKIAAHDRKGIAPSPGSIENINFAIGVFSDEMDVPSFISNPEEADFDDDYSVKELDD